MNNRLPKFTLVLIVLALTACGKPEPPTINLYRAVHSGDLDQVTRHLRWKTDINRTDVNGDYPLHVAARGGRVIIARELVEHGADAQALNAAGETAIETALINGKTRVAKMLLEHGVKLDAQAVLIKLVKAGVSDRDAFTLLMHQGASLGELDAQGDTLLHLAIARGHHDSVSRLIRFGADVSQLNGEQQTPLALALEHAARRDNNASAIVNLLESSGARAEPRTPPDSTP